MKIFLILFLLVFINTLSAKGHKVFSVDSLYLSTHKSHLTFKDDWIAKDKGMHVVGSFIAAGITMSSLKRFADFSKTRSVNYAVSFSFSIGLFKEIYDGQQNNNQFSYKDLSADLLGNIIAFLVFK